MLTSLQSFVQRRFHTLIMSLIGIGFLFLLAELIMYEHYDGIQLVAVVSTVLGALLAFLGIVATGRMRLGIAAVMLVLAVSGIIGVVEHNEKRSEGGEQRSGQVQQGDEDKGSEQGEASKQGESGEGEGEAEIPPPPLAPLSLSGLCAFGAVALFGRRDPS
jgi:hypothetical protein